MLKLPNKFKIRIINKYGQKGREWLDDIDNILNKYKYKFELENIKLFPNLNMNIVLSAKSHKYGNIVMKIGSPGNTSINEINIMKYYSSNYVPKCYYSCIDDRVMILEKIFPGYTLNNLANIEERIKTFSDIANNLLIVDNGNQKFPTFEELFIENIEYAHKNKKDYSDMIYMINIANDIYNKIKKMNLPKYILHYDLHHKNILKTENGWKAIDPHGIIGEKVLETSQFIRMELEQIDLENNEFNVIISLLSKYFKEDKKLILEGLYIIIIIKIISYIKNRDDYDIISYNIDICKKLLNYINN